MREYMKNYHEKKVKVALIIVNYKSSFLLPILFKSIFKNVKNINRYKILVVDNNSNDKNLLKVKREFSKYKNIEYIFLKKNLGFAGGNNVGIKKIKADYYCLINPDIILINDAVNILIEALSKNKRYGIGGPLIYSSDNKLIYKYYKIGGVLYEISKIIKLDWIYNLFYKEKYKIQNKIIEVDWVTGAFFMIKADVIKKIGYMDESFFLYSEESDYCIKAKKEGFKIIVAKEGKVIHIEEGSTERTSGIRLYYQYRSKLKFIKRHYCYISYLVLKTFYFIDIILKFFIRFIFSIIISHNKDILYYYIKLLKEFINNEI